MDYVVCCVILTGDVESYFCMLSITPESTLGSLCAVLSCSSGKTRIEKLNISYIGFAKYLDQLR